MTWSGTKLRDIWLKEIGALPSKTHHLGRKIFSEAGDEIQIRFYSEPGYLAIHFYCSKKKVLDDIKTSLKAFARVHKLTYTTKPFLINKGPHVSAIQHKGELSIVFFAR